MPFTTPIKDSHQPSQLNQNRRTSSDFPGAGDHRSPAYSPLPTSTPEPLLSNHAMSLAPSPVASPNTPHYPENAKLLQASSSSTGIGEAFMDLDDDDDEPPSVLRAPSQHQRQAISPLPQVQSPPHPSTLTSPPSNLSVVSSRTPSLHPSFNQPRQPIHPGLQRTPSRSIPSFTSSGTRSRPPSYAPSEEVMFGLGLGSNTSEIPLNMDKRSHLILYDLPTPQYQKRQPSTFSGSSRGPIAYAYDPSSDMNRPVDQEDRLHDPNARGLHDNSFPWRGVVNVAALIFMLLGMMALFLFYPIYTHYGDLNQATRIQEIIDSDGYVA